MIPGSNQSIYTTGAYDPSYIQMLGSYLTPTATGYKSLDPYFLSQGNKWCFVINRDNKVLIKLNKFIKDTCLHW